MRLEIALRVGHIVTDNEASNGVAVDHIFETLEPETYQSIKPKKAKKAALRKRWVRCLAHTLSNLISQAFLFGQDPEIFLMNTDGAELRGDLDVRSHRVMAKTWLYRKDIEHSSIYPTKSKTTSWV